MNEKAQVLEGILEELEEELNYIDERKTRLDGERDFLVRYTTNLKQSIEAMGEAHARYRMHVPQIVFGKSVEAQKFLRAIKQKYLLDKKLSVSSFLEIAREHETKMKTKPYFVENNPEALSWGWNDLKDAFISKQRRHIWEEDDRTVADRVCYVIDMPEVVFFSLEAIKVQYGLGLATKRKVKNGESD